MKTIAELELASGFSYRDDCSCSECVAGRELVATRERLANAVNEIRRMAAAGWPEYSRNLKSVAAQFKVAKHDLQLALNTHTALMIAQHLEEMGLEP